jgi:hypothetical protein
LVVGSAGVLDWDEIVTRSRSYRCNGILYGALLAARTHLGYDPAPGILRDLRVGGSRKWILDALAPRISPCWSHLAAVAARDRSAFSLDKHGPARPATRDLPSLRLYWIMLRLFKTVVCDPFMLALHYLNYPRYWLNRFTGLVRETRLAGPIRNLLSLVRGKRPLAR